MGTEAKPLPEEQAGSYVVSDASVPLPNQANEPGEDETYEQRRDREQVGTPRTQTLREMEETAPPAAEDAPHGRV